MRSCSNYIKYELFPQHVGHPWSYFPLPLTVQLPFQSYNLNKVICFSLGGLKTDSSSPVSPFVPPSIPKGTCRSLILSNLTNFLFLQTPITDVLCFVFCIFVFIFCLPNTFQFSKGQVVFILYPFMLLSKVLGLQKMHGKSSLNVSFH